MSGSPAVTRDWRSRRVNAVTRLRFDKSGSSDAENWFDADETTSDSNESAARTGSGSTAGTETTTDRDTTDRNTTDQDTTERDETGGQRFSAITQQIRTSVIVLTAALSGNAGNEDYYEAIIAWMVLTFGLLTIALGVVSIVVNPVILILTAVFGLTTGLMYYHLSGQMAASVYRRVEQQAAANNGRGRTGRTRNTRSPPSESTEPSISEKEAYETLGVPMDADQDKIKDAYRERVKAAHPDTDEGSEEEFKRIKDAYERLQE